MWVARLLPWLQHLTHLTTSDNLTWRIGDKQPLPRSLRTLHLYSSPALIFEHHTLPPRLTSLWLGSV